MVSLIIAAHNEAALITQKLDNTLALDYPRAQLEIIVASDGSDDGTNELVAGCGAPEVRLLALPRQGKNLTLNAAVAAARGDILFFTDADCQLMPDALRHMVAPFSEPEVGGVAGRYIKGRKQRVYSKWKQKVIELLGRAGSLSGAEGQIHAVRRELFALLPMSVNDDFYTAMRVVAAHRRFVSEPRALAYPIPGPARQAQFPRKVRMTTRWLQTIWLLRRLLNPIEYGFFALQFLSHVVLRALAVVPLLVLSITALVLYPFGWPYQLAALGQLGFHGAAALGFLLRGARIGRLTVLRAPYDFDAWRITTIVAIVHLLRGKRHTTWTSLRSAPQPVATKALPPQGPANHL
jgi:cellulose synthase/poly-beta-1,6-N-acetylglucosamine synthase-like glycosyltransferase